MDLLKALKRTTIIAGAAVLALGATQARAADTVDVVGHINASVTGTLAVTELSAVNFGNMAINVAGAAGDGVIVLGTDGSRTLTTGTDALTLLHGAGINDPSGLATGAQAPGFYTVANGSESATATVYISFANEFGAIMDTNHPNNYATITKGGAHFHVNQFNFAVNNAGGLGPSSSGYTDIAALPPDTQGTPLALSGHSATFRVGATLKTVATDTYVPGLYTGTFNVMVSY